MKLLTTEILNNVPTLGETAEKQMDEIRVWAKFFHPLSSFAWYLVEYDPRRQEAFGFVKGLDNELGYFSVRELESLTIGGLKIERDLHWDSQTKLSEVVLGQKL